MNTVPDPQQFDDRLADLEQDARAAARFLYAAEAIDHLNARRPMLADALDRDSSFWDTVLGALQTASIAALRRIYGEDDQVMSAEQALSLAFAQQETLFAALPEVRTRILRELRGALDRHAVLYETLIAPVRQELFTDSNRGALLERLALFQIVPQAEFERLVLFAQSLHGALAALRAGRPPPRGTPAREVAAHLDGPADDACDDGWENRSIARDTRRFLLSLEGGPPPDRDVDRRQREED